MQTILKIVPGAVMVLSVIILLSSSGMHDIDADGIPDSNDNCLDVPNPTQEDFDIDNLGNECDTDDDNDGFVDEIDSFDTDAKEWADFDFDGIGTNQDPDDDNDGTEDVVDLTPITVSEEWTLENLDTVKNCAAMSPGTGKLLCYGDFFDNLVAVKDNNADALQLAFDLSRIGAIDDCHFISHEIGHASFEENPNVSDNLRGMDSSVCRGGFYHGIMAAYFHDLKENHQSMPDYKEICNDFIGLPDYQDCIHGLGHGFVHYYLDDVQSAVNLCHKMSLYQGSLCIGGVMMQHTDGELTKYSDWENTIPQMCSKLDLSSIDYHQCNVSLGLSLAYHIDHNGEIGSKFCNLIEDEKGKDACLKGLLEEIKNAKTYIETPLTNENREKFQPQWIDDSKIIDIRTPSTVSNFNYVSGIGLVTFSFDKPQYIILYVPEELLPQKYVVTVNGVVPNNLTVEDNFMGEDVTMIQFVPNSSGIVLIAPA